MQKLDGSLFKFDPGQASALDSIAIGTLAEIEALLGEKEECKGRTDKSVVSLMDRTYGQSSHRIQSRLGAEELSDNLGNVKKMDPSESMEEISWNKNKLASSKILNENLKQEEKRGLHNKRSSVNGVESQSEFWNKISKNQQPIEKQAKDKIYSDNILNLSFSSSSEFEAAYGENSHEKQNGNGGFSNDSEISLRESKGRAHGYHRTISKVYESWNLLRINDLKIRKDKKDLNRSEIKENMRVIEENKIQIKLPSKKIRAKLAVLFNRLLVVFCNESPKSKFLVFYSYCPDSLKIKEVKRLRVSSLVSFMKKNDIGDMLAVGFLNKSLAIFQVHKKQRNELQLEQYSYNGINFDLENRLNVLGVEHKSMPRVEFLWEKENVFGLKCLGLMPFDLKSAQSAIRDRFEPFTADSRTEKLTQYYSRIQKKRYQKCKRMQLTPSARNCVLLQKNGQKSVFLIVSVGQQSLRARCAIQPANSGVHDT